MCAENGDRPFEQRHRLLVGEDLGSMAACRLQVRHGQPGLVALGIVVADRLRVQFGATGIPALEGGGRTAMQLLSSSAGQPGDYLPLHTFDDRELDAHGDSVQVDALLGILGALADLPKGWRAVSQLIVLAPAPHDWARAFQRLALERPLDQERRAYTGPSPVGPLALLGLVGLYFLGATVSDAWARGDWLL